MKNPVDLIDYRSYLAKCKLSTTGKDEYYIYYKRNDCGRTVYRYFDPTKEYGYHSDCLNGWFKSFRQAKRAFQKKFAPFAKLYSEKTGKLLTTDADLLVRVKGA